MPGWAIGFDIGGTKIAAGLVAEDGTLVTVRRARVDPSLEYETVLHQIVDMVAALAQTASEPVEAVGIGLAGQIDPQKGFLHFSPNLRWHHRPVRDDLQQRIRYPVCVTNDVRAVTWGEWLYGAGRGYRYVVCVFLGTGVGGSAVIDGQVRDGAFGMFGEIGHMPIEVDGRPCKCGMQGCLEAYVGGWAVADQVRQDILEEPDAWRDLLVTDAIPDPVTPEWLAEQARKDHPRARYWVELLGHYLGVGMVGVVNVLNPECLILGGGLLEGFPEWVGYVESAIRQWALPPARRTRVVQAQLGINAGVIGAAAYARLCQPSPASP